MGPTPRGAVARGPSERYYSMQPVARQDDGLSKKLAKAEANRDKSRESAQPVPERKY